MKCYSTKSRNLKTLTELWDIYHAEFKVKPINFEESSNIIEEDDNNRVDC